MDLSHARKRGGDFWEGDASLMRFMLMFQRRVHLRHKHNGLTRREIRATAAAAAAPHRLDMCSLTSVKKCRSLYCPQYYMQQRSMDDGRGFRNILGACACAQDVRTQMGLQTTAAQTPAQHGPEHSPLGFKQCSVTDECAARGTPTTHAQQARFSRTTGPLLPLAQRHRDSDQRNTQHQRPASLQQQRHTVTTLPRKTSYQNQGHFMPNHAITWNNVEPRRRFCKKSTRASQRVTVSRTCSQQPRRWGRAPVRPWGSGSGAARDQQGYRVSEWVLV